MKYACCCIIKVSYIISSFSLVSKLPMNGKESKSPEERNNRPHCKTERRRRRNMYRVFDTSGPLLISERTAKKKKKKKGEGLDGADRERQRQSGRKKSEDGIGPVTNTQPRTPGCSPSRDGVRGDAIRHDVFLASRNRRYTQCVLYIRRVLLLVRPITT